MPEENAKLPNVISYDTAHHVAVSDIETMFDGKMPEAKVRALLSLYCVEPVMQRKLPNVRGRGLHLYDRSEVLKAFAHFQSYFQ